ncbi:uncharacterized protein DFL_002998 [Arthrobotrys flagrans]|uniref:RING-type domain-containing protein n=1 Tax=Arthrobotrys flagrans TaxID=97331 RepID=A0A437AC28_ARTFL|nr:hypothetical protein DFL_002998 [Arthrobotrys flagrans]
MSYRGGEYGHGGYHQDMPVAQLGDMIDPEEFPKVAQHLQSLHISHPGSSSGSTGYPEDGARHIYVDSSTGSHYYTNETPSSIAPYSGYGYIQAPETGSAAPHAFAGAMRTPVNASFNHGRDRYEPNQDSDYEHRGRRPTYYRQSMEGYITPGANIPRTSTKTPGPGGELSTRRGTIAAIHQPRPPNSRHSSSESGDAEPTYHPSGRYDDYNGNARPKGKSRPNSFSYPRPTDSEPNFSARYPFVPEMDPRSSTGSLGNVGIRYNPPAVVHQPGDRYYKPYDSLSGPVVVNPGGRGSRYYIQPSQPIENFYYPAMPDERERSSFEAQRQRARSKSRFRARTPGPEERTSASEDDKYRAGLVRSRPSSPSSSQQRAKSRRRRDSPSPGAYRAKSRMRSKSRPRPEIIQSTRPPHGDPPVGPGTPGSARPKTPTPGSSAGIEAEAMFRMETERQERDAARQEMEREKAKLEMEREKARLEKERAIQEIYESMERVSLEQDGSQSRSSGKENPHRRHKSRARSRPRGHHSRSTSNERSERDSLKDARRRDRERPKDSELEREKERNRAEEYEKELNRDREREKGRERREKAREETLAKLKSEPAPKVTDPALANPMVENLNPPGRNTRERAGVQPGQTFIRPDLLCAMRTLGLCVAEHDPHDDHAHNRLLRLDCGHGFHEDCLRGAVSSRERIPLAQVDLEAEKLWCERCRNTYGKKAGM